MPYSLPVCPPSALGAQGPSGSDGRGHVTFPLPVEPRLGRREGSRPQGAQRLEEPWLVAWRRGACGCLGGPTTPSSPAEEGRDPPACADNLQSCSPAAGAGCGARWGGRPVLPVRLWPGPLLPVYIAPLLVQLPSGQGGVSLFPVNSHVLGWEPNACSADTAFPLGFFWGTTVPGLEGAGGTPSCWPRDRGSPRTSSRVQVHLPFNEIPLGEKKKPPTPPHLTESTAFWSAASPRGWPAACLASRRSGHLPMSIKTKQQQQQNLQQ